MMQAAAPNFDKIKNWKAIEIHAIKSSLQPAAKDTFSLLSSPGSGGTSALDYRWVAGHGACYDATDVSENRGGIKHRSILHVFNVEMSNSANCASQSECRNEKGSGQSQSFFKKGTAPADASTLNIFTRQTFFCKQLVKCRRTPFHPSLLMVSVQSRCRTIASTRSLRKCEVYAVAYADLRSSSMREMLAKVLTLAKRMWL